MEDQEPPVGDKPDSSKDAQERHIRSFVLRQARMTRAQEDALERLAPRWCVPYSPHQLDLAALFGREASRVLEIGFGMGHATASIAAANPQTDYLGVEVHGPGVGALLGRIEEMGLANLRIIQKDVVLVVRDMIAPESLDGVHIFFPDPWQKKKHHKRRLVQTAFLEHLATRVKVGGYVYLATDWQDYADWMLAEIASAPSWENSYGGWAPPMDWRPSTAFEHKGLAKDHVIREIFIRRRA